jgi:hypothetical protein
MGARSVGAAACARLLIGAKAEIYTKNRRRGPVSLSEAVLPGAGGGMGVQSPHNSRFIRVKHSGPNPHCNCTRTQTEPQTHGLRHTSPQSVAVGSLLQPPDAKAQGWRCFAVKERRPVRDLPGCGGTATECDTAQFNSAAGAALTNACGAAHGAAGGAAGVTQPAVTGGTAGGASGATGGGGYDTDDSGGDVAHTAGL